MKKSLQSSWPADKKQSVAHIDASRLAINDADRSEMKADWSLTMIADLAWEHFFLTGKLPNQNSPWLFETPKGNWRPIHNWKAVDMRLYRGLKNLSPGGSLTDLYVQLGWRLGELTEEIIVELIWDHYQEHKKWPSKLAGPVKNYIDENWGAVNLASQKITSLSLPKLIDKHHLREKAAAVMVGQLKMEAVDLMSLMSPARVTSTPPLHPALR